MKIEEQIGPDDVKAENNTVKKKSVALNEELEATAAKRLHFSAEFVMSLEKEKKIYLE